MVAITRVFDFYNKAIELAHPDPARGVLGRANLTGMKADFSRDGKVGLFGISERKASSLGWSDLDNIETNFQAAMELDMVALEKNPDINKMFMSSAGTKSDAYLRKLDEATEEINSDIVWEDINGKPTPVGTRTPEEENIDLIDGATKLEVEDNTKQVAADINNDIRQRQATGDQVNLEGEAKRLTQLLKEYINATV